jgi:hypothetical protein
MGRRSLREIGATFGGAVAGTQYRRARVVGLLLGIVLLSLGDLYMTLQHLTHFGMLEGNPLARAVMERGSPSELVIWKVLTVGFAVGIIFWARQRWAAEVAAVFCCAVLTWLTLRWVAYSDHMSDLTGELHSIQQSGDSNWVTMVPDDT